MRYSTDEKDYGYKPWKYSFENNEKILVYLDGVEVRQVMTVDTMHGYILKAVEPVHTREGTDEIAMEELRGNVTIKFELKEKKND